MPAQEACLLLLFARGKRPDSDAISGALTHSRVGSVSFDPAIGATGHGDVAWIEVETQGLTFDCIRLSPGNSLDYDAPRHFRGLTEADCANCEAVGLAPGPHLAGAGHLLPVVKAELRLAAALLESCPDTVGALWQPASVVIAKAPFLQLAAQWSAGGPFPAPALIATRTTPDGGVASEGLAFFAGEELRIAPSLAPDAITARRLLFRIADRLVESQSPSDMTVVELGDGNAIQIERIAGELVVSPA